ncbi:hypothetical protein KXD40_009316 [Peronospora effusa]|uniref:Protein kinase domain-containing protein n=1 Tax=Peronospora effusa TaxID=542832 RepID=A0A3M6VK08_9STRA|nr:hypothetical protein DD238_003052 [Peronospora effusa]RQM14651.1 hypothetical protein DD237_005784 [Peronospora effusa]UIZ28478.1 hypothetical protein KXD40_009316 [Peronospora effusa]CAI5729718.1 unnamed protein product [Peronospora effusa]
MDTVFAFFDSARGSMPNEFANKHQLEHLDDAEFHDEDETRLGYHLGHHTCSARSSRCSRIISTSRSVNDFDLLSVVGKGAYDKVFLAKKKQGQTAGRVYAMKVLHK